MKKTILTIISALCFCMLTSCEDDSIKMGTVYYYPAFWPTKADTTFLTKTFDFDFNDDAKSENGIFAEFKFVDNEGRPIGPDIMEVYIDGQKLSNNTFRIDNTTKSKEIKFRFTPKAESGKHQGYLKLVNHNLDRIDNQLLNKGQQTEVFQWTINFEKNMNPLAKVLMWLGIGIITAILLWKFIFIYMRYPRFRAINKMVIIPNQAPISIRFKGARMVVLDNVMHKQSLWNKFWTGNIIYKQNPSITTPITLKPRNKGRNIYFMANTTNYSCSPNPIGLQPSKVKDIINNQLLLIQ